MHTCKAGPGFGTWCSVGKHEFLENWFPTWSFAVAPRGADRLCNLTGPSWPGVRCSWAETVRISTRMNSNLVVLLIGRRNANPLSVQHWGGCFQSWHWADLQGQAEERKKKRSIGLNQASTPGTQRQLYQLYKSCLAEWVNIQHCLSPDSN